VDAERGIPETSTATSYLTVFTASGSESKMR
jgi:hypothetical protein